jgi:addiction module HigA family antidote
MNRKMQRRPTPVSEILWEEFMKPYQLTPEELAKLIGVVPHLIEDLLANRGAVTPDMALRFASLFGTSPEFWLNIQMKPELWEVMNEKIEEYQHIQSLQTNSVFLQPTELTH